MTVKIYSLPSDAMSPPVTEGFVTDFVLASDYMELQRKVEELAAEVQAIRWASGQVYVMGYNHGHLNTVDDLPYAEEKDLVIRGGETLCEYIDPDHCGVATDAILAELRAQIWLEAKDFTKSMLATDSVDHLDFLFDGKVQQLRKESGQ